MIVGDDIAVLLIDDTGARACDLIFLTVGHGGFRDVDRNDGIDAFFNDVSIRERDLLCGGNDGDTGRGFRGGGFGRGGICGGGVVCGAACGFRGFFGICRGGLRLVFVCAAEQSACAEADEDRKDQTEANEERCCATIGFLRLLRLLIRRLIGGRISILRFFVFAGRFRDGCVFDRRFCGGDFFSRCLLGRFLFLGFGRKRCFAYAVIFIFKFFNIRFLS